MASFPSYKIAITLATTLLVVSSNISSASPSHQDDKFPPKAFDIVQQIVNKTIDEEARMGASLIRLHFHDCFVNGCDGSVLLENTTNSNGEKFATPNLNSARGFEVIDEIKAKLEKKFPGNVSCADILAIAARDAVVKLGGPDWNVTTGRKDSITANISAVTANLTGIPAPNLNITDLVNNFASHDLSIRDLVALSGAHTVGKARCISFRDRIYNESLTMNSKFAKQIQGVCPKTSGSGDNNLAPLDPKTVYKFDNEYFKNLVTQKGLLHSDQQLFSGGRSDIASIVQDYAKSPEHFNRDFTSAMIKMSNIGILTGSDGEIRKNCGRHN